MRERLTGQAPPENAGPVLDLWRDWIEERAGDRFDNLGETLDDQDAFARATRDLIADLEMADELGTDQPDNDQNDEQSEDEERYAIPAPARHFQRCR